MNRLPQRSGWWITLDWIGDRMELEPQPFAFRSAIELPAPCVSARLRIYAFEHYTLWINGAVIATGPARSAARTPAFDTIDVAAYLTKGSNALAVMVTQPTGEVAHRGRVALWCDWNCECADGRRVAGCSDAGWRVRRADWYETIRIPVSLASTWQEHVDARREPDNWQAATLVDLDNAWHPAFVLGPVDWTPPWRFPEPRDVPLLPRRQLTPRLIWRGTAEPEAFPADTNLADRMAELHFHGTDVCEAFPEAAFAMAAGDALTFDLGRNRVVYPALEVSSEGDGVTLECYGDIRWNGAPSATGSAETGMGGLADSFRAAAGESRFQTQNPRGCRFWTLRAAGHGRCRVRLRLWSEEYPYRADGAVFESSDADWNAYWQIGRETLRSSTMDVFVDTVWREQSLWTRDAAVMGRAAFYSFGELAVWRRSLRLVATGIDADGVPVAVALGAISHLCLLDQTMAWVSSVADYVRFSGEVELLDELLPPVERFLGLCSNHLEGPGCFVPPAWSWHFVDWGEVDRRPYSLAIHAMLAAATRSAIAMRRWRAAAIPAWLSALERRQIQGLEAFYDPVAGWYRGHLAPETPERFRTLTLGPSRDLAGSAPIHGNALLLANELVPEERVAAIGGKLARYLETAPVHAFGPSWFDTILKGLIRGGQPEMALRLLRSRCQPAVDCGAPTYGEDFPFPRYNSAHGWSASVNTALVESFWGLEVEEPGCKRLRVTPCPGMPDGSYRLNTPAGPVALQLKDGKLTVDAPRSVAVSLTTIPEAVTV